MPSGIAARKAGEALLHVVGGEGRIRPLVTVGAENAGAIGVVEQHEIARELVLVGRDPLAEDAECGVAVALGDVAEDLVVGAVLLDDVDDVLEDARLADALRHRARRVDRDGPAGGRPAGPVRGSCGRRSVVRASSSRGSGTFRSESEPWYWWELNSASAVAFAGSARTQALDVGHVERIAAARRGRWRRETSRPGSGRAGSIRPGRSR